MTGKIHTEFRLGNFISYRYIVNKYSTIQVYDYLSWVDEYSLTRVFTNQVLKYDEYFYQYYFEFKESAIDNLNSKRLNFQKNI
jgi:hypothetical protein